MRHRLLVSSALLAAALAPSFAFARPATAPAAIRQFDVSRRLDAGLVRFAHTNFGTVASDVGAGTAGLFYPPGTLDAVMYSSGLWLGGKVADEKHLAIAEYEHEFAPGAIVGGSPDLPGRPEYVVWKSRWPYADLARDTSHRERDSGELLADPALDLLAQHGWGEYLASAAPYGAPVRTWRLPDESTSDPNDSLDVPGPDVLGRLSTWCVFNDADPSRHVARLGGTAPLGVEVQQRVWSLGDAWPSFGKVVFVRWTIVNRSAATIDSFRIGLWADPDLGTSTDDLVGWDGPTQMGYAYNGSNADGVYGARPPAVGVLLLTPPSPGAPTAASFHRYVNGADPQNATETWSMLTGFDRHGAVRLNPLTGQPAAYDVPGDPVLGAGWVDSLAADRRFLMVQPVGTLAPGATAEVTVAFVVAQGEDRLTSVAELRCTASWLRQMWAAGFPEPPPAPPVCTYEVDCPRSSAWWSNACGGGAFDPGTFASIASLVDQASTTFDWPSPVPSFCTTLDGFDGASRERALAEYAALLATTVASSQGFVPSDGFPIRLGNAVDVRCAGLEAATLGDLIQPAPFPTPVVLGRYLDAPGPHMGAGLVGVDAGFTGFGGGAAAAYDFFGGIDPATNPDSFSTVRITFDRSRPRKAYRFLRLELLGGGPPVVGRAYRYGGYRETFLTAVDTATGDTLALAFAERAVTDDDGTILDPGFQVATFDSTWLPDPSDIGGREYLFVIKRPWSGVPDPAIAVDGAPLDGSLPWLYALWSRRASADPSVLDDGDGFEFSFDLPSGPGADQALLALGRRPPGDPDAAIAYARIADCLGAINRGERSTRLCDAPTPTLASLIGVFAEPGRVSLEWSVSVVGSIEVERRAPGEAWMVLARVQPDGLGRVTWEDKSVVAGASYDYRLRFGDVTAGDVRADVPTAFRLALAGLRPNPGTADATLVFTLAGAEPATLELLDVSGRRVWTHTIRGGAPGARVLPLADARLAPGVYLVRLKQGNASAHAKAVIVR